MSLLFSFLMRCVLLKCPGLSEDDFISRARARTHARTHTHTHRERELIHHSTKITRPKKSQKTTIEHLVYLYYFEPNGYTIQKYSRLCYISTNNSTRFQKSFFFSDNKYKNGKRADLRPNIAENQALAGIQIHISPNNLESKVSPLVKCKHRHQLKQVAKL